MTEDKCPRHLFSSEIVLLLSSGRTIKNPAKAENRSEHAQAQWTRLKTQKARKLHRRRTDHPVAGLGSGWGACSSTEAVFESHSAAAMPPCLACLWRQLCMCPSACLSFCPHHDVSGHSPGGWLGNISLTSPHLVLPQLPSLGEELQRLFALIVQNSFQDSIFV